MLPESLTVPASGVSDGPAAGQPLDGPLLFVRFAFMPNHLGYCGSDVNAALLAYLKEEAADAGLRRGQRHRRSV